MPDLDRDLAARLDALGACAAQRTPPMPAALSSAVKGGGSLPASSRRVPLPALAAAAAVMLAGAALVLFQIPVSPSGGVPAAIGPSGPASLMALVGRFNRSGSIDAALNASSAQNGAFAALPVVRAFDARNGVLPE
jgi:hypothetical protein